MATTRTEITVAAHCILGNPDEMLGSPHRLFIDSHGDVVELGFYTARELRAWLRVLLSQHRVCRKAACVGLLAYRGAMRADGTGLRYSPARREREELPLRQGGQGREEWIPVAAWFWIPCFTLIGVLAWACYRIWH